MIGIVKEICDLAGGPGAVAQAIGVSRQALHDWKRVPPHHVLNLEALTGGKISRTAMRPDLYPAGR
jgi:DNA-binding transcriptional regulator YdaS (Cro superfamily)